MASSSLCSISLPHVTPLPHFSQRYQARIPQPIKPSGFLHPIRNRSLTNSFRRAVGATHSSRIQCTHMRDVNTEELDHLVTGERETPLVIDFCADWCGSCDILSEQLEELAEEYEGRVKFVQVNTDQEYDLADQLEIRGLPTMVFMGRDKSKRATRIEGMLSADAIRQLIDDVFDTHS